MICLAETSVGLSSITREQQQVICEHLRTEMNDLVAAHVECLPRLRYAVSASNYLIYFKVSQNDH